LTGNSRGQPRNAKASGTSRIQADRWWIGDCRGEQWDPDLGLDYLRARYYNPLTGRFVSVDSESGSGQRRYEYADANPVDGMDPSGDEAITEWALLQFYPGRLGFIHVTFPGWCGLAGGGFLPGCGSGSGGAGGSGGGGQRPGGPPPPPQDHWRVKIDYRPILSFKFGRNCVSVLTCHLPLRWVEHSYVEIDPPTDNPNDRHTWGVLGTDKTGRDQEVFEDAKAWDRDPLDDEPGVHSQVIQASDQQAQAFEQALDGKANSAYPNCPSCGPNYHNGPRLPIDVVSFFSAFNSNTFTWNVVKNFVGVTPDPIGNAPGFHYSPRYAGYP
jgi:RHS repeat-associated protein